MGIRFFCPRGHKLNVKAELAGKVGICPKCGERMLIPLESTREPGQKRANFRDGKKADGQSNFAALDESGDLSKDIQDEDVQVITSSQKVTVTGIDKLDGPEDILKKEQKSVPVYDPGTSVGMSAGTVSSVRNMTPIIGNDISQRPDNVSSYGGAPLSSNPSQQDLSQASEVSRSPLDLYPDAEWIIRGADNRYYGPSKSATIKKWIEDQRIGPSTPVRHKAWSEDQWSKAQDVFPELAPVKKNENFNPVSEGYSSNGIQVDTEDLEVISIEKRQSNRKKKAHRDLIIVLVLILLIAVLIGVLCFILLGQKKQKSEKTPVSTPASVQTTEKTPSKLPEIPAKNSADAPVENPVENPVEKAAEKPVE